MRFYYQKNIGNDLARVLRWGPGYTGGEDPLNLLRDVIDAEEIRLDRWTVVFHPEDKSEDKTISNSTGMFCIVNALKKVDFHLFILISKSTYPLFFLLTSRDVTFSSVCNSKSGMGNISPPFNYSVFCVEYQILDSSHGTNWIQDAVIY